MSIFSSPYLLGFDEIQRLLDRADKSSADTYPPCNIERLSSSEGATESLRIVLAVAGFSRHDLEITVERHQLIIKGRRNETGTANFLHRGIAARPFHRTFVLAEGMEVRGASLENGLLAIELARPEPQDLARKIEIRGD
jgi:HSP20 family molecular chaperone IbpA